MLYAPDWLIIGNCILSWGDLIWKISFIMWKAFRQTRKEFHLKDNSLWKRKSLNFFKKTQSRQADCPMSARKLFFITWLLKKELLNFKLSLFRICTKVFYCFGRLAIMPTLFYTNRWQSTHAPHNCFTANPFLETELMRGANCNTQSIQRMQMVNNRVHLSLFLLVIEE